MSGPGEHSASITGAVETRLAGAEAPRRRGRVLQLLDCGEGRRLERFGPYVIDRPAPSVERVVRRDPATWGTADARYERAAGGDGAWSGALSPGSSWRIRVEGLTVELRLTDTGQIGLFPEQLMMWRWIRRRLSAAARPIELLNLFAHTGCSTLAAASAGATVVHVDGSRGAVAWARRNAALSGLVGAPIRWIVEDVDVFVRRELRRGRRYDAVVLDPPSFGHGPDGQQWRLDGRLPDLLRACAALTSGRREFLLVTTHQASYGPDRLRRDLAEAISPEERPSGQLEAAALDLAALSGARLSLGGYARWSAR